MIKCKMVHLTMLSVIKLFISFLLIGSFKSETIKQTTGLQDHLQELDQSIESVDLDDIGHFKPALNRTRSERDVLTSNVSYSVPIKYLSGFHTNIPSRVPYDRSSAGRKPPDGKKSKQGTYQFGQNKLADHAGRNGSNIYARLFNKKLQFKEADQLSNNISDILEKLLINYDKNERPNIEGDTVITTNIHIRSMGPMSEQLMEYSLDCYFRQKWHDSRLKYEGPFNSLTLNIHMLQLIWKPDVYVINGKGSYVHEITRPNKFLRIYQDGGVYYSMRLTVKARCFMELKNFPMDKQSCPLMFGSYGYQEDELKILWEHKDPVSLANDLVMSQFDLISYPCRNSTRFFRKGRYSMVQVNFNFIRHTGYFLIQIYFPCGLIVVISWVSFWINRENTADRVGLGITSVLTLSTFGLEVSQSGPKVSYPTALNWFMIICFVYANATLIQFSFVHYFTKIGSGELPFYYQQLKTKEKNKEKAKQSKLKKLEERIRYIDEQTRHLKETDPAAGSQQCTSQLANSNELSLLSEELTTSYDDSNDNLILNNMSFEDEINDSQMNEHDRELELQMLDIKRILSVVELDKRKNRFNELQKPDKHKRRPHHVDRLTSVHSNEHRLVDPGHYLVEDLENEEPTFKFAQKDQQPMYCPRHNRWFSSSVSNSFDEQTEPLPEDMLSLHGQQFLDINENLSFGDNATGKMAHGVLGGKMLPNNLLPNNLLPNNVLPNNMLLPDAYSSDAAKQWAIDVNQTAVANRQLDQSDRPNESKRRKKNKVYREHSLDQQLPFMRWKKVYSQNRNPLNAFNLNHFNALPNGTSPLSTITGNSLLGQLPNSAAFKRQQFRKNERYSSESYDTSARANLSEDGEQPNVARKRTMMTKTEPFEKKDAKQPEANAFMEHPDPFKSTGANEKKAYWFENLRLPKLVLQFITCIIASEDYRDHILRDIEDEHVNSVSKVDTLSKYLFPLTFILVNIIYWLYYYGERSAAFDAGWKESEVFQII